MLSSLIKNKKANVTLIFALLLTPIMGLVGFAIDTGETVKAKRELRDLMDSAALTAVGRNAIDPTTGIYNIEHSKKLVETYLNAYLNPSKINPRIKDLAYDINVKKTNQVISTVINYSAKIDGVFSDLTVGTDLAIQDEITATSAPPTYLDVVMLVDASASMLIGASKADQDIMKKEIGCAFACHIVNDSNLTKIHSKGAKVRFDVVKEAIASLMDDAKSMQVVPGQFSFSLYSFALGLQDVQSTTTDMDKFKAAALGMKPIPARLGGGTNFRYSMQQLNAKLGDSGSGISMDNRRRVLMIFTDGVATPVYYVNAPTNYSWIYDPNTVFWGPMVHWAYGFNAADCNQFKNKRITVATLYTEYINAEPSGWSGLDTKLIPLNKTNLKNCASAGNLHFTANDEAQVHAASEEMFKAVMAKARLNK